MPVLDLSAYKPVPATLGDANQVSNGMQAIQNAINALDNNNFAAGKIFDPAKLMQNAAVQGQGLVWNGTSWVPAGEISTIADVTLGAPAANIDFTSIPQTFAHLMVKLTLESAAAAIVDTGKMTINGDTTAANYNSVTQRANSGAMSVTPNYGTSGSISAGVIPAATLNNWSSDVTIWIPNYRSAKIKAVSVWGGFVANTSANGFLDSIIAAWLAAVAINRLTFSTTSGSNFVAGARATLYGCG